MNIQIKFTIKLKENNDKVYSQFLVEFEQFLFPTNSARIFTVHTPSTEVNFLEDSNEVECRLFLEELECLHIYFLQYLVKIWDSEIFYKGSKVDDSKLFTFFIESLGHNDHPVILDLKEIYKFSTSAVVHDPNYLSEDIFEAFPIIKIGDHKFETFYHPLPCYKGEAFERYPLVADVHNKKLLSPNSLKLYAELDYIGREGKGIGRILGSFKNYFILDFGGVKIFFDGLAHELKREDLKIGALVQCEFDFLGLKSIF
ncbi:hypothetical protein HBN50_01400 [Halobacteriovorax sp. GB3]|uniref:hypothetical protein n=1 Tax=Halobacteriovorax sp. GB3 TaxID=2719615 RepID=UPI00236238B4|nr:hypothetical protein [Halobacteriovorax sp. GB3]MDD0851724.1 hypothetical protein [Halobacteriovorax sp. GB3]